MLAVVFFGTVFNFSIDVCIHLKRLNESRIQKHISASKIINRCCRCDRHQTLIYTHCILYQQTERVKERENINTHSHEIRKRANKLAEQRARTATVNARFTFFI